MKLTAQNVTSIDSLNFVKGPGGQVEEILVNCQVNFGKFGIPFQAKILKHLSENQKGAAQTLYNKILDVLNKMLVTDEIEAE